MVSARNAVHSALWLVLTMLCLGVFYVLQAGPFIGMVQIIVYTGAIMMLFLFVLMLVGRDASDSLIETLRGQRVAAIAARARLRRPGRHRRSTGRCDGVHGGRPGRRPTPSGNVQGIAALLFTKYVFAFEVTSALLITAAVGAMVLAHIERRKDEQGRPGRDDAGALRARATTPARSPARASSPPRPRWPPRPGCPTARLTERSISPILPTRELTAAETAPKGTEGR